MALIHAADALVKPLDRRADIDVNGGWFAGNAPPPASAWGTVFTRPSSAALMAQHATQTAFDLVPKGIDVQRAGMTSVRPGNHTDDDFMLASTS